MAPADESRPWQLRTVDDDQFTAPDLSTLRQWISEGRLHPDDQVSRTGRTWVRLGELPEFADAFVGFSELPALIDPVDPAASERSDLGPPPDFRGAHDSRADMVEMEQLPADASAAIDLHGLVPTRPEEGPVLEEDSEEISLSDGAVSDVQRMLGAGDSASAMQAVQELSLSDVSISEIRELMGSEPDAPVPRVDDDAATVVARPAAGDGAAPALGAPAPVGIPPVRDRSGALSDGAPTEVRRTGSAPPPLPPGGKVGKDKTVVAPAPTEDEDASVATSDAKADAANEGEGKATLEPSDEPIRPRSMLGAVSEMVKPIPASASSPIEIGADDHDEPAKPTKSAAAKKEPESSEDSAARRPVPAPPEPAREKRSSWPLVIALGALTAAAVVFGVPDIRERVLGGASDGPQAGSVPEIGTAQAAIRGAQPDALDAADRALQARIAGGLTGDALARAQLAQAEVVASLAIWQRLMAAVDPAQSDAARFDADDLAVRAAKILASVDARAIEAPALVKARARVQLAEGSTPAPVAGDAELALLVQASALWQDPDGPVPTGLVAGLMQLAEPSALARCVLAIAHVRSGDEPGARAIVDSLTLGASPPPVAVALARVLREPETPTPVGDTEGGGDTDPDAPPTGPDTSAVAVGPGALVDPDAGTEPAHDSGGNSGGNSGGDSGADTGAGTTKPPKDPGRDSGGDGGDSPQTMSVSKMIDVGCSKAETGKGAEALDLLEKAKERRPGDLDISICMGLAYLDLGRNSQALSAFDHVLERSPKMGAALRGAAKAARKSGKTKQAVEYYKRVLEMEPRNAEARAFVDAQEGKGGNDAGDDDKPTSPTPFDTGTSESKSGDGE